MKRRLSDEYLPERKRHQGGATSKALSYIEGLSDELLLRAFGYLSITDIAICQCLNSRFYAIGNDSQLWRSLYFEHFIASKDSPITGLSSRDTTYSSKLLPKLQQHHHMWRNKSTNWKNQYKLALRWKMGNPNIQQLDLSHIKCSNTLVCLHRNFIYLLDNAKKSLTAWSTASKPPQLISQLDNATDDTAMVLASDLSMSIESEHQNHLAIGFKRGEFHLLTHNVHEGTWTKRVYQLGLGHDEHDITALTHLKYHRPFILTLQKHNQLQLVRENPDGKGFTSLMKLGSVYGFGTIQLSLHLSTYHEANVKPHKDTEITNKSLAKTLHASIVYSHSQGFGLQEIVFDYDSFEELEHRVEMFPLCEIPRAAEAMAYAFPYVLVSSGNNFLFAIELFYTNIEPSATHGLQRDEASIPSRTTTSRIKIGKVRCLTDSAEAIDGVSIDSVSLRAVGITRSAYTTLIYDLREIFRLEGLYPFKIYATAKGLRVNQERQLTGFENFNPKFLGYVGFDDERIVLLRDVIRNDVKMEGNLRVCKELTIYDFS